MFYVDQIKCKGKHSESVVLMARTEGHVPRQLTQTHKHTIHPQHKKEYSVVRNINNIECDVHVLNVQVEIKL